MEKYIKSMRKAIAEAETLYLTKAVHQSYQIKIGEMNELYKEINEMPYECLLNAFNYGFIKGMRYQKSQENKNRKAVKI